MAEKKIKFNPRGNVLKLTPLDVKRQEFRKVMRGYDVMEVDAFLEMVAEEYESLLKSKNESVSRIKKLEEKLKEYQEIEKTLQKTLMDAQKSLSKSKEDSKKEAELIIKEAEITANKIIEDSRREDVKLKNEIMLLNAQKESLAIRLKHILNSQIELINILEMDDQEIAEFKKKGKKSTNVNKENLNQPETQMIQNSNSDVDIKRDKNISKVKKGKVSKETLFGVIGSKGENVSDNDQNLIEKMVLEIENEEIKKEKPFEEDNSLKDTIKKNKNNSVRGKKSGKEIN